MKKQFLNTQFVFFINDYFISNKSEFVTKLKDKIPGEELILNVSSEIPQDFPYITLNYQGEYEIRIAKNRIEFFDFKSECIDSDKIQIIHQILFDNNFPNIQNVGLVTRNKYLMEGEIVNSFMKKLFTSENNIINCDETSEIKISNIIREQFDINEEKIKINKIFTLYSNQENEMNLLSEFDINSRPNNLEIWKNDFVPVSIFINLYNEKRTIYNNFVEKKLLPDTEE